MTVLNALADIVIILAGIIMFAAGYRWIRNNTYLKWHEAYLWRKANEKLPPAPPLATLPFPPPAELFVTYEMADGSMIDDFQFVTSLEWFDDRDGEIRLTKSTYALLSTEEIVLPDPNRASSVGVLVRESNIPYGGYDDLGAGSP